MTFDAIEKAILAKLQTEHDRKGSEELDKKIATLFADTDPAHWVDSKPWWMKLSSRFVPYINGEVVLVAVASVDAAEMTGPVAVKTAGARAGRARQGTRGAGYA